MPLKRSLMNSPFEFIRTFMQLDGAVTHHVIRLTHIESDMREEPQARDRLEHSVG